MSDAADTATDIGESTKKCRSDKFTEIDFKVMIKNQNTTFAGK